MLERQWTKIMLVDDQPIVRHGLATFISLVRDLELVGLAANGQEAVALCQKVQPHVILMDISMPKMDGIEATIAIRADYPQVQVIILSAYTDVSLVQAALKAGAISYLLKTASTHELVDAIRAARVGRSTLSPEVAQALIQAVM